MVLRFVTKEGTKVYGLPYTKEEEADFYSRNANGPVRLAELTLKRGSPKHRSGRRRQNRGGLEVLPCSDQAPPSR